MTVIANITRKISTKMQIANESRANRMRQAWVIAKSLGLKRLTKECFGVQKNKTVEKHPLLASFIEAVRPFAESNLLSEITETMKKTNGKIYGGSKNGYNVYINNVLTPIATEAVNIYNNWKAFKESTTLVRTMTNHYWAEHKPNCLPLGSLSSGVFMSFLLASQGIEKITNNYSVSPASYLKMLNSIEVTETQEEYNDTKCFVYVVKCKGAKTVKLIKHPTTENLWYEMFD